MALDDFSALLALYYHCDAIAALRPVGGEELTRCAEAYAAIKHWFRPVWEVAPQGSPERHAQNLAAYAGFKEWEAANVDLVERLRGAADRLARGGAPALR